MTGLTQALFGAKAQVIVGVSMVFATAVQTVYWLVITPPTIMAVFLVSMEALFFAGYGVLATGLGFRATERVETAMVENIEQAGEVNIEQADEVNIEEANVQTETT